MNLKLLLISFLLMSTLVVGQTPTKKTSFSISPNPATTKLNVHLPASYKQAEVIVYDVLGKQVYKTDLTILRSSINVSKWNSGVYLVKITSGEVSQTKRFVKQ